MATYKQVSYGSKGSDVTELQKLLNKNGANLTVDGVFGSKTQEAVKNYQKANNLTVDGIVGTNTWGALTKVAGTTGGSSSSASSTPANQAGSYDDFKASDATLAADKNRQAIASQKPGDFSYGEYEESDLVKQANALLQQHLSNKPGEYQSAWQDQLNEIFQQIQNREKFSYDLNGDALYQQYKDQYTTQGKMAMMDTMGQASAMTGGYGNSYAQSVGQQTYQGYLQQLNERVPELYQLALSQYNQEGQDLYNQYGMIADMENQDYGRYRDSVSDYNAELARLTEDARYLGEQDYGKYMDGYNMAYGQHRDSVSDWQTAMDRADNDYWTQHNLDYGQYRDQIADQQWQAQFDEAKRQYDETTALSKANSSGGSSNGSSSGGKDTGKPGAGYDNGGYESSVVKQAQNFIKVSADGKWGPASQAAAKKLGYNSIAEVVAAMNAGPKADYNNVVSTLNQMVKGGGDPNSKQAMETLGGDIRLVLNDALKDGAITKSEYNKLWSLYGPIQNAYN